MTDAGAFVVRGSFAVREVEAESTVGEKPRRKKARFVRLIDCGPQRIDGFEAALRRALGAKARPSKAMIARYRAKWRAMRAVQVSSFVSEIQEDARREKLLAEVREHTKYFLKSGQMEATSFTFAETAKRLSIGVREVRAMARRAQLMWHWVGDEQRISKTEVERELAEREAAAANE